MQQANLLLQCFPSSLFCILRCGLKCLPSRTILKCFELPTKPLVSRFWSQVHLGLNPILGVRILAQWLTNSTRNHGFRVRTLASLSGLRIQHCCELWCRSAAAVPSGPLAWEPPYAEGAALEKAKRQIN